MKSKLQTDSTAAALPISVTIITKNEASRIEAAILSVRHLAQEIIVIDSESKDRTVEIAQSLGAKVVTKPFVGFGQQKNFAHDLAQSEWVLNLDADERVSPELEAELRTLFSSPLLASVDGFFVPRKTWYLNRWILHGGWYPNYLLRLAKKSQARWTEPSLHEALEVKGKTHFLREPLLHYSFPDQRSHILKNIEYANHAKQNLIARGKKTTLIDLTLKPVWKFFDIYFLKSGFLDGKAGFFIAVHSAYSVFLRYTYLYEETTQNSHSR